MASNTGASTGFLTRSLDELGLLALYHSSSDVKLLCLQRFTRLFAYGASTLILVTYLEALHISKTQIGLFMTMTLVGDIGISFFLTLFADGLGRKTILILGALLMIASGIIFAFSGEYWALLFAAIVGVISPRQVAHEPCVMPGQHGGTNNKTVEAKSVRFGPLKRVSWLI